jgi:hypothetical protein
MSNRSLVELNHDFGPGEDDADWARSIRRFLRASDKDELPQGVTFLWQRHHTDPCPVRERPRISSEVIRIVERQIRRLHAEVKSLGYEPPTLVGEIAALDGLVSTLYLLQRTDVHPQERRGEVFWQAEPRDG